MGHHWKTIGSNGFPDKSHGITIVTTGFPDQNHRKTIGTKNLVFQSQGWTKIEVVKWWQKGYNWPILMHIYHK